MPAQFRFRFHPLFFSPNKLILIQTLFCNRSLHAHPRPRPRPHPSSKSSRSRISKTRLLRLTIGETHILQCLAAGDLRRARYMLDEIPHRTQLPPVVAWTSLLTRYSREGCIDEARTLFEIIPDVNLVTYNAMLSGYIQSGRLDEALRFFHEMPEKNVVSWTTMLTGLMASGMVDQGKRLFQEMPERNVVTWNSMITGILRNGDLEGARCVFDAMPVRDLVSWNTMIDGYVENAVVDEARSLFDAMKEKDVISWTTLISGYCRTGDVGTAYELFQRMPEKNIVSWTAMIGGFAWNGFWQEAILLFLKMRRYHDIKPNDETFVSLTYGCAGLGFPRLGRQVHTQVIVSGLGSDGCCKRLCEGLIFMYSKFLMINYAESVFFSRHFMIRTLQSCNSMINGYIQNVQLENARYIFDIAPLRDKISWTSMINGYLGVGEVAKAWELFSDMPEKDAVAWTAMISGHVQNELFSEAYYLFFRMRMQGLSPLQATYSSILGAAGASAHLDLGRKMHCLLLKSQPSMDLILENALMSMYAKCGQVDDALLVFSKMHFRDLVSWNSMIMGFSQHGMAYEALDLFKSMTESGIKTNSVTLLGVLSACSHSGLIGQGIEIYKSMNKKYGIQPDFEHTICIINLLGRAGKVAEVEQFVSALQFEQEIAVWGALLGVCGFDDINAETARRSAQWLLMLDPENTPAHIVLCNMNALAGQYEEVGMRRRDMKLKGMRKVPGCSWLSQRGNIQVFLSGERAKLAYLD